MAEWQTQQTQNLPTINRVGSSPTSPTKAVKKSSLVDTINEDFYFRGFVLQVTVEKVENKDQESAVIRAVEITDEISGAIELLEGDAKGFAVSREGKTYIIKASAVYYIESVDKKTFVYTKQGCYDCKYRLYELEVMLGGYFMRCSKSMIINLKKVRNVKSQISGRIDAMLLNDEVVVISRGYVKEVKRRLGIG